MQFSGAKKPTYSLHNDNWAALCKKALFCCEIIVHMPKLSAVIITRNEARNIRRTLDAISWCDEILVVDSGSTDDTQAICMEYGARVIVRDFQGFGPQKRFAVESALYDWVLCLDADEVVPPALKQEIQEAMLQPEADGYIVPRTLVFLGRPFKYGRESREFHLRLFNRAKGNFNSAQVHEKVEISGKTLRFRTALLHYSYPDTDIYFQKFNEYTRRAADELLQRKKSRSQVIIFLSLPFNFLKHLILHGNILNGYPGWIWSLYSAFYPVVKYTKVWESRQK